jgi:hypothetical protein
MATGRDGILLLRSNEHVHCAYDFMRKGMAHVNVSNPEKWMGIRGFRVSLAWKRFCPVPSAPDFDASFPVDFGYDPVLHSESIPLKSKLAEALLVTKGIARCLNLTKRFITTVVEC